MHCNIILRKPTPERLQLRIAGFFPRSVRTDRTGNLDAGWGRDVKMTVFIFNSLDESDGKSGVRSDVIDDRLGLRTVDVVTTEFSEVATKVKSSTLIQPLSLQVFN